MLSKLMHHLNGRETPAKPAIFLKRLVYLLFLRFRLSKILGNPPEAMVVAKSPRLPPLPSLVRGWLNVVDSSSLVPKVPFLMIAPSGPKSMPCPLGLPMRNPPTYFCPFCKNNVPFSPKIFRKFQQFFVKSIWRIFFTFWISVHPSSDVFWASVLIIRSS